MAAVGRDPIGRNTERARKPVITSYGTARRSGTAHVCEELPVGEIVGELVRETGREHRLSDADRPADHQRDPRVGHDRHRSGGLSRTRLGDRRSRAGRSEVATGRTSSAYGAGDSPVSPPHPVAPARPESIAFAAGANAVPTRHGPRRMPARTPTSPAGSATDDRSPRRTAPTARTARSFAIVRYGGLRRMRAAASGRPRTPRSDSAEHRAASLVYPLTAPSGEASLQSRTFFSTHVRGTTNPRVVVHRPRAPVGASTARSRSWLVLIVVSRPHCRPTHDSAEFDPKASDTTSWPPLTRRPPIGRNRL